jgi:hypothetical protein
MIIKILSALLLLSLSHWFIGYIVDAAHQSSAQFSHLNFSRAVKPYAQVVQTKRKVQFAILHYSDLESGEISDGIPVPLEINVSNGVVINAMKDQV